MPLTHHSFKGRLWNLGNIWFLCSFQSIEPSLTVIISKDNRKWLFERQLLAPCCDSFLAYLSMLRLQLNCICSYKRVESKNDYIWKAHTECCLIYRHLTSKRTSTEDCRFRNFIERVSECSRKYTFFHGWESIFNWEYSSKANSFPISFCRCRGASIIEIKRSTFSSCETCR